MKLAVIANIGAALLNAAIYENNGSLISLSCAGFSAGVAFVLLVEIFRK